MTAQCPVRNCGASIKPNYLMCPHHWRRVPRLLKHAHSEAWAEYDAEDRGRPRLSKIRAIRSVQTACIEAVEAGERRIADV